MTSNKRPLSVTIVGWVDIVVGAISFGYYFAGFRPKTFQSEDVWIELVRFLAIVAGAFMLRAQNWARWLALAWIAFHVVLSAFHGFAELAVHSLFCAVIAWFLFRPDANRYFRGPAGAVS